MDLEHTLQQKKAVVISRATPTKALEEINKGKKFIIVDETFNQAMIPLGYMLIDMQYKGDSFRTLVPQQLLFYLANPGEGGVDDALDEISDFYSEIKDFEDEKLEGNGVSVQGANWAVTARNAYCTYLINKLTKANDENPDVPEWNEETLKELNLDDEYVAKRVRAISALCLGKTSEQELRKYNLGDVLRHVTINEQKVEQLTEEEFNNVACWAGSHYDIKEEYQNNPNVTYKIDKRHDRDHKAGEKITHKCESVVLDAKVADLEKEISEYRAGKNGEAGKHDEMLTRMYANISHIAPEDSSKQLVIIPPEGDA